MSPYEAVDKWELPVGALADSIAELAPDGKRGNEGIVLWAGHLEGGLARVVHLIGLHGPLIRKLPLQMIIDPDLFVKISLFCAKARLTLLGQIHSHPKTFTDLSEVDKKYGIATPNFLSVVAPHYGQRPATKWTECGVHVFEEAAGFRRMSVEEVQRRVVLDPSGRAPLARLS